MRSQDLMLVLVVLLLGLYVLARSMEPPTDDTPAPVTVVAPSSAVGGMGMPGKAGSGMQWNREEEVQDEQ